ncbi:MAG: phosphomannomutase/phosphoglucomutase [Bdellovibrionaceae bacterium]|nr:phosphomannomutase/phosphoglucomutase [Pseudobdellovibrionaceae bacterium]
MHDPVIFREYDIRGVFEKQFDLEFVRKLGQSYAVYLQRQTNAANSTVTVGFDARLSSPSIRDAMVESLTSSGLNVLDLGLITSPISYFSTFTIPNVAGAVMITGSHNPPDYNGFKISVGKGTIFGEAIQELRRIMDKGEFLQGKGTSEKYDIFPAYVEKYKKEFGLMKPIKVVLDTGNGAGGCIARRLYEAVGLKPTILFEEPDGRFPNHHPDPTVEKNLVDLRKEVLEQKAIVGIGFDGDADRIGLIDETGRMIYGDELMVLISRSVLQANPGAKIIGDVKCSDRMYADVKANGGVPVMWKTGHSLIKEKIKSDKSPFGGEMSGHIFFADRNYGYDDALYAGLRVCEILSKTGKTITQLLEGLPSAFNTPEIRVDTTEEKKVLIVEKIKEAFPQGGAGYKIDETDGIRLSFEDGWALARSSNTQPVLVLRFESTSEAGLKRIRDRVENVVNKYL